MSRLADVIALAMPRRGSYPCAGRCGATLELPGLCDPCGQRATAAEHDAQLRPALASIPERFRWSTPDAPDLAERVSLPIPAAELPTRIRGLMACRVVTLLGSSGRGKTSLACALLRAWIDVGRWGASEQAVTLARRARFIAARHLAPEGARDEWLAACAAASRASVLLLDDVGQESGGASFRDSDRQRAVADVLLERHDRGAPTIVTSYLRPEQWVQAYGDGVARRYTAAGDGVRVVDLDKHAR